MQEELARSECPSCGSPQVATIHYGLPGPDRDLLREIQAGRVVLGGCTLWAGMPDRLCVDCRHRWEHAGSPETEVPDA